MKDKTIWFFIGLLLAINAFVLSKGLLRAEFIEWLSPEIRRFVQTDREEYDTSWFGMQMQQFPNDLYIYEKLIYEVKPDRIIEIGTFKGGLTHFLAMVLSYVNPNGRVVSVDIDGQYWRESLRNVTGLERLREKITFIEGNSVDNATVARVKEQVPDGAVVLVLLDSYHSSEHVFKELNLYADLVSTGSYVIINDTQHDEILGVSGPLAGTLKFAAIRKDFSIAPICNKYSFGTSIYNGCLKKNS